MRFIHSSAILFALAAVPAFGANVPKLFPDGLNVGTSAATGTTLTVNGMIDVSPVPLSIPTGSGSYLYKNATTGTTLSGYNLGFECGSAGSRAVCGKVGATAAWELGVPGGGQGHGIYGDSLRIGWNSSASSGFLFDLPGANPAYDTTFSMDGTGFSISTNSSSRDIRLKVNGNTGLVVNTDGTLLLGSSSTAGRQAVYGGINFYQGSTGLYSSGLMYSSNEFNFAANLGSSTDVYFNYRGAPYAITGYRFNNGTTAAYVPLYASAFTPTSDYRVKSDVVPVTSGIATVLKINPVEYQLKFNPPGKRTLGVIAHELQAVLPQAVNGKKDAMLPNGDMDLQAVDYAQITTVLVKAFQEQHSQIECLVEADTKEQRRACIGK